MNIRMIEGLNSKMQSLKHTRGLHQLTPERRSQIAQMGGKAAQAKGVSHKFTSEEAKLASIKGSEAKRKLRRLKAAEDGKYLYAASDRGLVCLRHPTYKVGHPPGAECPYCWKIWYQKESNSETNPTTQIQSQECL